MPGLQKVLQHKNFDRTDRITPPISQRLERKVICNSINSSFSIISNNPSTPKRELYRVFYHSKSFSIINRIKSFPAEAYVTMPGTRSMRTTVKLQTQETGK